MPKIPVYQVTVPEYKIKKLKEDGKYFVLDHFWKKMKIPKVYENKKPNFDLIGNKIDNKLKKYFLNKKVAIRAVCSGDHGGKSADDLIKIIKKLGHDRYNPKRKGDRYDNVDNHHIDFFALDYKINNNGKYFENLLIPLYYWPIINKKKPNKIDIIIIYDLLKLKRIKHRYKGRENEIKKDGFIFKDKNNKSDAIIGIMKIL